MTIKCETCNVRYANRRVKSQINPTAEHFYCLQCLKMNAEPSYLIWQRAQAVKDWSRDLWFLDQILTYYDDWYLTAREYLEEVN